MLVKRLNDADIGFDAVDGELAKLAPLKQSLRTLDAAERQKEIFKTSESGHYDLFPITVMNRVSRS